MSVNNEARLARRTLNGRFAKLSITLAIALIFVLGGAGRALAAPLWRLSSRAAPANLSPGATGLIVVSAENLGDTGVKGSARRVTISDVLPQGLDVTGGTAGIRARRFHSVVGEAEEEANWSCSLAGVREASCTTSLTVSPYEGLELLIPVEVSEPPGTVASLINEVKVQGGEGEEGAATLASATLRRALAVSGEPVHFGLEAGGYALTPEEDGGTLDTQAGSHPFQLTTSVDFNQTLETLPVQEGQPAVKGLQPAAPALAKSLSFNLPPGLLGNVTAVEQCSEADFLALGHNNVNFCPAAAAVGVATVAIDIPKPYGYINFAVPLFNLVPAPGEPARFGFEINKVSVVLDASVRTAGGDYGVSVSVSNASQTGQLLGSEVTFWGVPGDPRHDASRGWACLLAGDYVNHEQPCDAPSPRSTVPLLTLPTSCTGQLATAVTGYSWSGDQLSGEYILQNSLGEALESLEGCGALPFEPSIDVHPEQQAEADRPQEPTSTASTPTGLDVAVKVPQQGTLEPAAFADADVKSATVTLPEGMQLNPSAANGLEACSEAQVGYLGQGGTDPLSPGADEPLRFSSEKATCPESSKIGSVAVKTPLLDQELTGSVYLATPASAGEPGENPFNSLVAIYVLAENEALGLRVKLAGEGHVNPETGQITTTFTDTPQVPFEELELKLFGGPQGPLTTPPLCGSYTSDSSFVPWSGTPPVASASAFQIISGPGGAPCANPLPFAPAMQAGSINDQAGAFTAFTLQIAHRDGDRALTGVTLHLPPGVAAMLASVTPCGEPQASRGECGPQSEIGQASAASGLGPDPYIITDGRAYLTGPYQGAPFGLSIVTPAVAGPFNLGNVVVRSAINVDPHTAAVTITSTLPTIVQGVDKAPSGIPLQLKQIKVSIDRPNFEFNPTNCNRKAIEGTLAGVEGATATVSSPFQVTNCAGLPFKPRFTARTKAQASKANGANFDVKIESKGLGQANIAKVRLQLPKQLPARLTTLQKACTERAFNTNPALCPEGSVIGQTTIHTPVLASPLRGPAYLVSHGGAAFPDVEFVLQGEGVTVVIDGKTQIKDQITYSKFESAPDAPFTVFETVLPQGPHSALTANLPEKDKFNLCSSSLSMPTEIVGQNGAVIKQNTKIALQGCKKVQAARPLSRTQLLKRALAACRKKHRHARSRRVACQRRAQRLYAAKKSSYKAGRRSGRSRTKPRAS